MNTEKYLEEPAHQKLPYVNRMPFHKHIWFDFHVGLYHTKSILIFWTMKNFFPLYNESAVHLVFTNLRIT